MPPLQGLFSYPGLTSFTTATYTLSHGIAPGACVVTAVPQLSIAATGNAQFTFGGQPITLRDCRIGDVAESVSEGGITWTIQLLDRRWKWAFGEIYGAYNRRDDQGRMITSSEKTPRQLARLLLEAMGESVGSTALLDLPDNGRPEVDWNGDTPAVELERLVDLFGCRVVLGVDGSVSVRAFGRGGSLPNNPAFPPLEKSLTIDPPERPDTVRVLGGPSLFQAKFRLEAVGMEVGGEVKKIDDLSYKPTTGWGLETDLFSNVQTGGLNTETRKACLETVFRWYRIAIESLDLPYNAGTITPATLTSILPLNDVQIATYTDPSDSRKKPKPAAIVGEYWQRNIGTPINTPGGTPYKDSWQLDAERGIVVFAEPVRRWSGNEDVGWLPAKLELTTSFSVRHPDKGTLHRWFWLQNASGGVKTGAGPEVSKQDELVLRCIQDTTGGAWTDNKIDDDLEGKSRYYADGVFAKYATESKASLTVAGLLPVNPDGAIAEVTWSIAESGATTTISRNTEVNPYRPAYQRRFEAKQLAAAKRLIQGIGGLIGKLTRVKRR